MNPPSTITLAQLAGAQRALGLTREPIELWPAAPPAAPAPFTILGDDQGVLEDCNDAGRPAGPIGCQFVRDVSLEGSGYLLHGEAVVVDGSELSNVAVDWIARPMQDSPRVSPAGAERIVEDLAIVAIAPGHLIYRHWLLDFLPRLMVARDALGQQFRAARIVLPHDTPDWALEMIGAFAGVNVRQYLFYRRGMERLALQRACIPSYVHKDYAFHPYAQSVFASLATRPPRGPARKLCLSRALTERFTHGQHKLFRSREAFEDTAARYGYEIILTETMGIREKAALFGAASHVVGEYGSGLHNTVFGPAGLRCGFVRCSNQVQVRIGAMRRQPATVIVPAEERVSPGGIIEYALTEAEMRALFDANEG